MEDNEDLLIQNDEQEVKKTSDFTFLHHIAILYEANKFEMLKKINFGNMICATCLQFKPRKTEHCRKCNICIDNFSHHSTYFGKCINSTNHFFYLMILFF